MTREISDLGVEKTIFYNVKRDMVYMKCMQIYIYI